MVLVTGERMKGQITVKRTLKLFFLIFLIIMAYPYIKEIYTSILVPPPPPPALNCTENCTLLGTPARGVCRASCNPDEVDLTKALEDSGYVNPTPACPEKCCCLAPCGDTSIDWWCAFDNCSGFCEYPYDIYKPTFHKLNNRPPEDFYEPFEAEYFMVWCTNGQGILDAVINLTSNSPDGYYNLSVACCDIDDEWTESEKSCEKTAGYGETVECSCTDVGTGCNILIKVENISASGTYNLSVDCGPYVPYIECTSPAPADPLCQLTPPVCEEGATIKLSYRHVVSQDHEAYNVVLPADCDAYHYINITLINEGSADYDLYVNWGNNTYTPPEPNKTNCDCCNPSEPIETCTGDVLDAPAITKVRVYNDTLPTGDYTIIMTISSTPWE